MKKILIGAFVALLLGVGAALWFLSSRLDSLVAGLIEQYGSQIVGTPVRVGSVAIDLRAGRGTIRGLRVANPEGYSGADAFRLGEITVDIDLATLTQDPIGIDELVVASPEVDFEVDARARSNFQVLQANVNRYSAGAGGGSAAEPAQGDGDVARLRIAKFDFQGGKLRADVTAVDPDREPLEVELPPLRLRNVAGTPAEIGKRVLGAFTARVVKTAASAQAGRLLEDELGGEIEEKLGSEAGKAARDLFRKLGD